MAEPTGARNISQALFQLDEKLSQQSDQLQGAMMKSSVSAWNSIPMAQGIDQGVEQKAYINQSRMSTMYQDNPWPTLMFSTRFGLEPMGGEINGSIPPGHRPGNTLNQNMVPPAGYALGPAVQNAWEGKGTEPSGSNFVQVRQPVSTNNVVPRKDQGIYAPSFARGFFEPHNNVY